MEIQGLVRDKRCFLCQKITQLGDSIHHDYKTLKVSAARGCPICHFLYISIDRPLIEEMKQTSAYMKLRMTCSDKGLIVTDYSSKQRIFEFFLVPDGVMFPVNQVFNLKVHKSPTSEACFRMAQDWIASCDSSHEDCQPLLETITAPTRLIDVSCLSPRVVANPEDGHHYLTLTYCWGTGHVEPDPSDSRASSSGSIPLRAARYSADGTSDAETIVTTTMATFKSRSNGIAMSRLPKTLQDAISITRRLDIKYLWVDSLCIIQDSVEDWAYEASRMGDYYANSYLTLSALDSGDARSGMLLQRQNQSSVHIEGNLFLRPAVRTWGEVFRTAPLSDRAWALQERILARRIIHYGKDELFWECSTCSARESTTGVHVRSDLSAGPEEGGFKRSFLKPTSSGHMRELVDWYRVVRHYSSLSLTRDTDKLPALSGLASRFRRQFEECDPPCVNDFTYYAGLWLHDIHYGLLWFRNSVQDSQAPATYQAPTWSWASRNESIAFMLDRDTYHEISTFDAHIGGSMHPISDHFGAITGGWLIISGLVKPVSCCGSRRRNPELYIDPELDLVVDILDADQERIGTGYIDSLHDYQTSLSPNTCTAVWISKWAVMANDGQKQSVVYFLLVAPCLDNRSAWKRIGVGHSQDLLTKEVLGEGAFYDCEPQTIILL